MGVVIEEHGRLIPQHLYFKGEKNLLFAILHAD
jgi:hypothetical protein